MTTSKWTIIRGLVFTMMFAGLAWGKNVNNSQFGVPNQAPTLSEGNAPNQNQAEAPNQNQADAPNRSGALNPVGALNYVEGQASINGQPLTPRSVGTVQLNRGQSLVTHSGKAEILLTPGVFLRVDDHSSVSMISPSLAPTEVEITRGRAMVEVAYIRKENNIRIDENGASTKLLRKGLYDFDADTNQIRVFKGEAEVYIGKRKIDMMRGQQVTLNASAKVKSKGFKASQYKDDFYSWSSLRSAYVLQANANLATEDGGDSYGPNWYWDQSFGAWAFPYDWGWGFYSPFFGYGGFGGYGGYGYYPYGRGFGGRGYGGRGYGGYGGGRGYGGRGFGGGGFGGGGFHGGGVFHGGGGGGGGRGR